MKVGRTRPREMGMPHCMYYVRPEDPSRMNWWGFPGGAVGKNPPANAGDTGSSPGPGRSHMPWSN